MFLISTLPLASSLSLFNTLNAAYSLAQTSEYGSVLLKPSWSPAVKIRLLITPLPQSLIPIILFKTIEAQQFVEWAIGQGWKTDDTSKIDKKKF